MTDKNEKAVALVGESFVLTTGTLELNADLAEEVEDQDMTGYESSRKTLPIVKIQQKPVTNDAGTILFEAGGFKIYDRIAVANDKKIANIDGKRGLFVTILGDQRSRIYWEKMGDEKPRCKSLDYITGIGDPGGLCIQCPLKDPDEKGEKKCKQQMNLLARDHNLQTCYVIQFTPSGLAPYDLFKGLISQQAKSKRIPLFALRVAITTKFVKAEKGDHYIPVFTMIDQTPLPLFQELRKIRAESVTKFEETIDIEEEVIPDSALPLSKQQLIIDFDLPQLKAQANDRLMGMFGDDLDAGNRFLADMVNQGILSDGDLSLANKEQLAGCIEELWIMEGQRG